MSEKIIDPHSLLGLYKSDLGRSRQEKRLFDRRLTDEADKQTLEDRAVAPTAPAVPNAQLVYNPDTHETGVAVKYARYVCTLPKGYGGPGCELALLSGDKLIVVQPDMPPLLIDPDHGTTRRL